MLVALGACGGKDSSKMQKADSQTEIAPADQKRMIIAKLTVKPDRCVEFIAAARGMIEKSNLEAGCTFYQLYRDPYDSTRFVFVEEYKNQIAVDNHFSTEYFKSFGSEIADLVAGPAEIKVIGVASEELK